MALPGDPPAAVIGTAEQEKGPQPTARSPLDAIDWPVRTTRLLLRPATPDDAEAAWTYPRLESVNYWLSGAADTFEQYRAVFENPARLAKTLIVELRRGVRSAEPDDGAPGQPAPS